MHPPAWAQALMARYVPFADAASADLPLAKLWRLSLFQVAIGIATALLVGTLNRVMIVELGVPAWWVALTPRCRKTVVVSAGVLVVACWAAHARAAAAETGRGPAPAGAPAAEVSASTQGTEPAVVTPEVGPAAASMEQEVEVDVLVPDVGEAQPVTVFEGAIKTGEVVAGGDLLVLIESDKASMEITAETAGRVVAV
ncbi:MAG: biotin/lipoyl-containing protein, partial [Burkholderiaceae bacterium]